MKPSSASGGLARLARRILYGVSWPVRAPVGLALRLVHALVLSLRFWVTLFLAVIVLLVVYYAIADRYTPLTTDAYVQAFVTQIAPQVEGRVVRVHVRENQKVKAGEPLFELDPRPFEHQVALLEAKLVQTKNRILLMENELAASRAEDARIEAEEAYARAVYQQEEEIFKQNSTTRRNYLDALQKHQGAIAARKRGMALTSKAENALAAKLGDVHALVAEVQAELAEARLKLSFSKVVAPSDGVITNLQLREGAFAHVGQAVLALIETGHWVIVANFREKCLERMREGQPALVAFQAYPGRMFTAQVKWIGWGVGQGQGSPSGLLPEVKNETSWIPAAQRFQVRLILDDPEPISFRVGLTGSVSVYHDSEGWIPEVTRSVHRVISWWYFL